MNAAADALVQRHGSLRAAFQHEHLSRPVQVIVPVVRAPWRSIDLSALDEASREERLQQILAEDCGERFDLARAPLLRFTLIRLGADRHRLLFTNHHILMDGWSVPVLMRELLTLYGQRGDGGSLPRVTPYRDYLAWLAGQDRAAAVAAWSAALAGLEAADAAGAARSGRGGGAARADPAAGEASLTCRADAASARGAGLTLNTYVQGLWAILLGRLTGRDDVVFGVTVAGRPPEIAGIESMVGLFINTLPLRVKLRAGAAAVGVAVGAAGQPVAADGASASRPGGDPEPGRVGRAVRHAGGVRELSGRPGRLGARRQRTAGHAASPGTMRRIIL